MTHFTPDNPPSIEELPVLPDEFSSVIYEQRSMIAQAVGNVEQALGQTITSGSEQL